MEQAVNLSNAGTRQPGGGHERRLFYDKCGRYLFIASACLMTLIIFSIIFFVGRQGLMTLTAVSPAEFFTSASWDPSAQKFGALSFIVGSVETTLLSVLIGAPLGLLGAVFLAKLAPVPLKRIMRPAVDLYVAIPSVVYRPDSIRAIPARYFPSADRFWRACSITCLGDHDYADNPFHQYGRAQRCAASVGGSFSGAGGNVVANDVSCGHAGRNSRYHDIHRPRDGARCRRDDGGADAHWQYAAAGSWLFHSDGDAYE